MTKPLDTTARLAALEKAFLSLCKSLDSCGAFKSDVYFYLGAYLEAPTGSTPNKGLEIFGDFGKYCIELEKELRKELND